MRKILIFSILVLLMCSLVNADYFYSYDRKTTVVGLGYNPDYTFNQTRTDILNAIPFNETANLIYNMTGNFPYYGAGGENWNFSIMYSVVYFCINISDTQTLYPVNLSNIGAGVMDGDQTMFMDVYEYPNYDSSLCDSLGLLTWNTQLCDGSNFFSSTQTDSVCTYLGTTNNMSIVIDLSADFSNTTYPIFALVYADNVSNRRVSLNEYNITFGGTLVSFATTTTLPSTYDCNESSECNSGWLCANNTCIASDDECFIDNDCNATINWCDTRLVPNFCMFKWDIGSPCTRNHQCDSNNCTVHDFNSVGGDYPPNYPDFGGYNTTGICVNSSTSSCTNDGECSAGEFCNLVGGWGVCEPQRPEGIYCGNSSWCSDGLSCINGLCQNQTTYGDDECDPLSFNYKFYDKKVWSTCTYQYPIVCSGDLSCFCGKETNISILNTCIPRINATQRCDLFRSQYSSIEYRYEDRDEVCKRDFTCAGSSVGSQLMRLCVPQAWECMRNRGEGGNYVINTFIDEYCNGSAYCDISGHTCLSLKNFGESCVDYYECSSYSCINSVCASGGLSATKVEISANNYRITSGSSLTIFADYMFTNNTKISLANCNVSSDTNVFNITDNVLSYVGGTDRWYISSRLISLSKESTSNKSVVVTCQKDGIQGASSVIYIEIIGTLIGNATSAFCNPCPSGMISPAGILFGVSYRVSGISTPISGATCTLYVDNVDYGGMSYIGGTYKSTFTTSILGSHTYSMQCNKTGFQDAMVSHTFTIVDDVCDNGRYDLGEEGVDCGGICGTPCPTTCDNDLRDIDESDVDCGGTSRCFRCVEGDMCQKTSDCEGGLWCRPHYGNVYDVGARSDYHCRIPTCDDGWRNGDESGNDCGGSGCPACPCSDAQKLDGCASDGSETCNVTDGGTCTYWTCDTNSDCTTLLLKENGIIIERDRECISGVCKFKSHTEFMNSTIRMKVSPISNLVYTNNSINFYIGTCEEFTNTLKINTDIHTHTQYQIGTSPYSPAISANAVWKTFGEDGIEKTMVLEELCDWTSGTLRYARIGIHSEIPRSSTREDKIIDMIIFNDKYDVNVNGVTNQINFLPTRLSDFYIRGNSFNPYIKINAVQSINFTIYYLNVTNTSSIEWFANNTYGESDTGIFTRNSKYLFSYVIGTLYDVFLGWWLPSWSYWLIIPIAFGVFVVLPLGISFFIWVYLKQREGGGQP